MEQYSRKNSLETHGVPQDAYISKEHVVIKVAENLNITVKPEDTEISHKIYRGKAIIAKFVNHKVKSKLYKERTRLKSVKLSDILSSYPATSSRNHRVYRIFSIKRPRHLFKTWPQGPGVYLKPALNSGSGVY